MLIFFSQKWYQKYSYKLLNLDFDLKYYVRSNKNWPLLFFLQLSHFLPTNTNWRKLYTASGDLFGLLLAKPLFVVPRKIFDVVQLMLLKLFHFYCNPILSNSLVLIRCLTSYISIIFYVVDCSHFILRYKK